MATRGIFDAQHFNGLVAGGPGPLRDGQGNFYVPLDAATDESVEVTSKAAVGWTGTVTCVIQARMATATTNVVRLTAAIEAITPLDAVDTQVASSFDTANEADSATVPATAGHIFSVSITCTNADSIAAGDRYRLRVGRNADHANDTATGDCEIMNAEIQDGA